MPFRPAVRDRSAEIYLQGRDQLNRGIGQGLSNIGRGVGRMMENRAEQRKEQKQKQEFMKAFNTLKDNPAFFGGQFKDADAFDMGMEGINMMMKGAVASERLAGADEHRRRLSEELANRKALGSAMAFDPVSVMNERQNETAANMASGMMAGGYPGMLGAAAAGAQSMSKVPSIMDRYLAEGGRDRHDMEMINNIMERRNWRDRTKRYPDGTMGVPTSPNSQQIVRKRPDYGPPGTKIPTGDDDFVAFSMGDKATIKARPSKQSRPLYIWEIQELLAQGDISEDQARRMRLRAAGLASPEESSASATQDEQEDIQPGDVAMYTKQEFIREFEKDAGRKPYRDELQAAHGKFWE